MTPMGEDNLYSSSLTQSAAVESAVDAYATKLLRQRSPPEACIDDNLGPYVTSMLRCSMPHPENIEELPDFDSLMELLEEHCSLQTNDALSALSTIANVVQTGVMEQDTITRIDPTALMLDDPTTTTTTQFHFPTEEETKIIIDHPETPSQQYRYEQVLSPAFENNPFARSGADKLIPVDLMGVLDNPTTPVVKNSNNMKKKLAASSEAEAFPPLGSLAPAISKKSLVGGKPPRNSLSSLSEGKDLAAALFRPRQHSIGDEQDAYASSSVASPSHASTAGEESVFPQFNLDDEYEQQQFYQQVDSVIDMLLSMNPDLSEQAAAAASSLSNADVNVAQYVVDGAMSAPPVCRHMLNDGCYRSDCQFSHDVDGHTCLFWLRGRCGKGNASCRFNHGFSIKLLEGINRQAVEAKEESTYQYASESKPVGIPTKNLLSHNMEAGAPMNSWSSAGGGGFSSGGGGGFSSGGGGFSSTTTRGGGGGYSFPSKSHGWGDDFSDNMSSSLPKEAASTFSFASIASKGYKNDSFATKNAAAATNTKLSTMKYVKIPQDLWNHHVNRDAGAFHIQDPLQRYAEVCKSVPRNDVIDLHFQSTKTFSIVLAHVLPRMLRELGEVWVVTGSGHHVARNSHQIKGGALEAAVQTWLEMEGYTFVKGRDRNGHSGAILVKQQQQSVGNK